MNENSQFTIHNSQLRTGIIDYDKILRQKVKDIKPSGIRKFFDIAAEMKDVISLSVGEPDFHTPWHVREVAIDTLKRGRTWYSPNAGFSDLCKEITKYYARRFNCEYNYKDEVLVTVGGSEAIDLAMRVLVSRGDEVIIPQPSFVCYSPLASLAGGVVRSITTYAEDNFRLTPEALKSAITPKTKLLILPYPNNPTGAVMRRHHLEAIAEVIKGTDILVISDEIYGELTYGGERHVSFAEINGMRERTIVVSGFSKSMAMTGWRLGYALGPQPIIAAMTKIHQFSIMCAPTTAQYAAIQALRQGDEDVASMRDEYNRRRRLLVDSFREMGFDCFEPEGAFYIFPSISCTGVSSGEFCEKLLRRKQVVVVPGDAFGDSGEGFIRVSYAASLQNLTEAIRRIGEFVSI